MIRLLVVDDEPQVCDYLATILQPAGDIDIVGSAADGAEAVESAVRLRPDVILMDLRMPGLSGIEATARIAKLVPATRIIAMTTFDADTSVLAALRSGACGFLLKSTPPENLAELLRVAAAGHTVMSAQVTTRLIGDSSTDEADAVAVAGLTARERGVLELMAAGRSNAEIAERLSLSQTTVKGYVSRVLDKLGCSNRTQAGLIGYRHLR